MFNGSNVRQKINKEQLKSIYTQSIKVIEGIINAKDAAQIANVETGMNINSALNTISNIEHMLNGEMYKYSMGYDCFRFIIGNLIRDFPDRREKIVQSAVQYQEKRPNQKIKEYMDMFLQ